ncbi:winged helix-turn-helix domain-containing protein [Clostridium sp. AM58-1XD]|uniref:GntR family transcriptional regulator n=1 Tax=Clostridium sp. AM58-1XD TaxID=2292307 RepID=UPI0011C1125A|nr:winged helix-turn-helix domain-containing protein [Clostridium sp. AM58-1XD]
MDVRGIEVKKDKKIPMYQQVSDGILKMIDYGELKNGDCLMPERKLSERMGISRGTVRKAYMYLKDMGMVISKKGGNYYVSGADKRSGYREIRAARMIDQMLKELMDFGLTPREISQFVGKGVTRILNRDDKIMVGVIECRKDVYYVFERFFSGYPDVEFNFFVLDELTAVPELLMQAESCDLILTTASHYYDICRLYPSLESRMLEIITLWSQKTLTEIHKITSQDSVGVIYSSVKTVALAKSMLKYFNISYKNLQVINQNNIRLLEEFFLQHDVLIAEPMCSIFSRMQYQGMVQQFQARGGKIIIFEHYIDRDSSKAIDNEISRLAEEKSNERYGIEF